MVGAKAFDHKLVLFQDADERADLHIARWLRQLDASVRATDRPHDCNRNRFLHHLVQMVSREPAGLCAGVSTLVVSSGCSWPSSMRMRRA
jgi:hypothetical protein